MSNNYTITIVGLFLLINIMWLMTSCVEAEMMGAMTASSSPLLKKKVVNNSNYPTIKQEQQQLTNVSTSKKESPKKPAAQQFSTTTYKPTTTTSQFTSPTTTKKATLTTIKKPKKGTYTAKKAKPNKIRKSPSKKAPLYLMDKAQKHIKKPQVFAQQVRKIAHELDVPPEWIMAVIHSESNFKAGSKNMKGSGAKGLIQFMPRTCKSLGMKKFPESAVDQLKFVHKYFHNCQQHRGPFRSATDLKLSVLYPKAVGKKKSYTLYKKPSIAYRQNKGLDKNKDGRVTVADVESSLKKAYPALYHN